MSARPTPASVSRLYDAVALGMSAYVRMAFRVETLGLQRVRLEPGTILAATHRSDSDVPVLCAALYRAFRGWRGEFRPAFAIRDDLVLPGFFAGYPRRVPAPLRRALFKVSIGRVMTGPLACCPMRSATRMRLVEVLRERPSLPLATFGDAPAALERRARERRLPPPRVGRAALRGEYADLLWHHVLERENGAATDGLADLWARRTTDATADLRRLVELLRRGSMLFIFPEGRPSPDGSVGPIMRGVGALAGRGGGGPVQPLALAYDPLTRGRPRVLVAAAKPLEPPLRDVEGALLDAFRGTLPLTAGELVAERLVRTGKAPSAQEAVSLAQAERERGRPVEPALLEPASAAERVAEAAAAAQSAPDSVIARLVRTHDSVRGR